MFFKLHATESNIYDDEIGPSHLVYHSDSDGKIVIHCIYKIQIYPQIT